MNQYFFQNIVINHSKKFPSNKSCRNYFDVLVNFMQIKGFQMLLSFVFLKYEINWLELQLATYILSLAHNCKYLSILAAECSAPCPSYP